MKAHDELNLPENLRYSEEHEWARQDGDIYMIGISDYAQDQLGDIVYVEMPEAGTRLEKGEAFGTVESVKAVSELYMPLGGEVVEVNSALEDAPELLNDDPYTAGWIIKVRSDDAADFDQMMAADAYLAMIRA